jgi:pimeloyl-ACP methyl ester carboxylesterase
MGREYISSHRAIRQLALRLSNAGFHVLRFDFYGCGDSAGNAEQGEICQWVADISTAIGEIRSRSGLVKVCLVGCRLGGTLAVMAGAERGDIGGLVLWDAVVSGKSYVEELIALHQALLQRFPTKPKREAIDGALHRGVLTEILGFALTDFMRTELQKIDLLAIRQKPANDILLVESNDIPGEGQLAEHLKNLNAHLETQHLPSPQIWTQDSFKALVPNQILQAVVSWISEVYS